MLNEERQRNERLSEDEQFWRNKRFEEMNASHFKFIQSFTTNNAASEFPIELPQFDKNERSDESMEPPPHKKQKIDEEFTRRNASMTPLLEDSYFIDPSFSDYDLDFGEDFDTGTQSLSDPAFDSFVFSSF